MRSGSACVAQLLNNPLKVLDLTMCSRKKGPASVNLIAILWRARLGGVLTYTLGVI